MNGRDDRAPGPSELPPPLVLVVDDDADTRDMSATYFRDSDICAVPVAHPGEGVETIEELKSDLIVTDIDCPPAREAHPTARPCPACGHTLERLEPGDHRNR